MKFEDYTIILGSQSPRRQQILADAGIKCVIKPVNIDEEYHGNLHSSDVAKFLAEQKAKQFSAIKKNEIILTADTIVVINDIILGKPASREEATAILSSLSGKVHNVITGVCLKSNIKMVSFDETTKVHFKKLTDEEISFYIENYEPYDKAGSYGIQEWIGMIAIDRIEGSYYNVMGLPIHKVYSELQQW
jgi:septum formation protein